jgi:hypothetical protein
MEKWQKREMRRQEIIDKAVQAADQIIMEGSDGSEEETNFLTAEVARNLMEKALHPVVRAMNKKDFNDDHTI